MDEITKGQDPQWPLVTFAVFAYNQEKYIREAVEGALAQDYPNLQIIFSDDCSRDSTYEIIKDVVRNYSGPHRVAFRQSKENRGVLHHVAEVARRAEGALIILAAGDDISKPERTSELVSAWQTTGAWGLCSRFDRIDETGRVLEESVVSDVLEGKNFRKFFFEKDGGIQIVHGCSSAYDIRLFSNLRLLPEDFILSEDGALSVLINMLGEGITHLDTSLVSYREHANSLTNDRTAAAMNWSRLLREEDKIAWFAKAQANRYRLFLRLDDELSNVKSRGLKLMAIKSELSRQELIAIWWQLSFFRRLAYLPRFLRSGDTKWVLARLLGKTPFLGVKWLYSHMIHAFYGRRNRRHI